MENSLRILNKLGAIVRNWDEIRHFEIDCPILINECYKKNCSNVPGYVEIVTWLDGLGLVILPDIFSHIDDEIVSHLNEGYVALTYKGPRGEHHIFHFS